MKPFSGFVHQFVRGGFGVDVIVEAGMDIVGFRDNLNSDGTTVQATGSGDTAGGPKGDNSPGNTANSCAECNGDKSNKPILEWIKEKFGE